MDTDGVLKLDKCPECGRLFPAGAVHVCEGARPMSDAERKKRNFVVAVIAVLSAIAILVIGTPFTNTTDESNQTAATSWRPTEYRAVDYDEVLIGMSYGQVTSALQGRGEVESTYTDSDGTRIEAKWLRGDSYISVTFFNGRVTDKYAKGLDFR